MEEFTPSVVAGLSVSLALMIPSALLPEFGWMLGVALTAIGVISLITANLQSWESGGVFGFITLIFGLAVEFASVETLGILLVVAFLVDVVLFVLGGILEAIYEAIEGLSM